MGQVVDFGKTPARQAGEGVSIATLVGNSRQIEASLLSLRPGARYSAAVPRGSDQYLYVLSGTAQLEGAEGGPPATMTAGGFAIIQEDRGFTVSGTGDGEASLLAVAIPPDGGGAGLAGFTGGRKVVSIHTLPVLDVPEQKKQRIFLATHDTVGSDRGHAMIVRYVADTVTPKHCHPNAESMFVLLEGNLRFLINGEEVTLTPGQMAHFPMNDVHALRSADGKPLHFLEFHVPGKFTTNYAE